MTWERDREEGAARTGHSQEAHPGACLWSGPPGSSRRRSGADGRLRKAHGSHSMFIRESYLFSTMLKKKILEMFRYTRENFMSR